MDSRALALADWCGRQLDRDTPALVMVSGDASFRRYFRLEHQGQSMIAMDAPPQKEDSSAFVSLAQAWHERGVQVPRLIAHNLDEGFLLLEDFGDVQMQGALQQRSREQIAGCYQQAIAQLVHLQRQTQDIADRLPPYDAVLLDREMALFRDWLLLQKLGLQLSASEESLLSSTFDLLRQDALQQAKVTVHRDYHSRNLMCLPDSTLGILDFQDAVLGPVTYDLVSLLRDCYVRWPSELVMQACHHYYQLANSEGIPVPDTFDAFYRAFEWMGMQRHLKASGIFARLALRDGKLAYLQDIPNTVRYLAEAAQGYAETRDFADWLQDRVVPLLNEGMR
ncbi:MAG: phosphotransferase [Oleiphilaceae bacterium]|nr:phosphotransferase [Oleiphilaceae bacterium]